MTIDRIYTRFTSDESHLRSWDQFCQAQPAANAVRNRKHVFTGLLRELAASSDDAAVLNVGSGPARDIADFLNSTPAQTIHFTCVDNDSHAIAYASRLCGHTPRVRFIQANAMRFRPDRRSDLVWSGGLFDYLNDRQFVRVANRLYQSLKPSGVLVIGNFSQHNPSRALMELLLKWHLNHRSPEQLRTLARSMGASSHCISIDSEPEGINLFLRLRASGHA